MNHVRRSVGLFALFLVLAAAVVTAARPAAAWAQDEDAKADANAARAEEKKDDPKKDELTLEKLFPEKSYFGPNASRTEFSHDGAWGAYLYRPWKERRHGNDLWLLNTETGELTRVTKVSVMAPFQAETREVKEYRIKKAKEAAKKRENGDGGDKGQEKNGSKPAEDPVTGTWEGTLSGGEALGLPEGGVAFVLELERQAENAVIGILKLPIAKANLSGATFDPETGALTGTLTDPDVGTRATLNATIKNDAITGEIAVQDFEAKLLIEGTRTKAGGKGNGNGGANGEGHGEGEADEEIDTETGDWVGEDDAEDEKGPRYDGVREFAFSPVGNEMLFVSGGDIYRYEIDGGAITRLTMTQSGERQVEFLPDGTGYTFHRDNALYRVEFGSHLVEQMDPELPRGESLRHYEMSPDGTRAAIVTFKGDSYWGEGRTVNIAQYRDRFMQIREVRRHVSDDPMPDAETSVYVYERKDPAHEKGELTKVYTRKVTGPRDVLTDPKWSPDSNRVVFAVYSQDSNEIQLLEAACPERKDEAKTDEEAAGEESTGEAAADDDDAEDDAQDKGDDGAKENEEKKADEKKEEEKVKEARVLLSFLHRGGPNTPGMVDPRYMADGRRIVYLSEQSGFRHLCIFDPLYETIEPVTSGRFEVYPVDMSEDHERLFVTSTKEHPARRDVYMIDLSERTMTRLTPADGTYSSVAVSDDGSHVLANFVDYGQLEELFVVDVAKGEQRCLTSSHSETAKEVTEPTPEFFTFTNRHGHELHGMLFKPNGATNADRRPLLIYVYGGPLGTRKEVTEGSYSGNSYFFAYYMAKKHGFVAATIDTRGMSGYGGMFERANFEQVGRPQVEDLVDGAKYLAANHGVDPEKVGIHGWSFGGFQTQMCLYTEPDVFACGIAGAGPTEWENYNSWYSTGTIGETREGHPDLEKYSLLPLAKNLEDPLLLIHGMEDSNVLYQDTVRVYRELLKAGKETLVELFLDPTGGHGLGGDVKALNRYRKYEEFLVRHLGEGPMPEAEKPAPTKSDETKDDEESDEKDESDEDA